MSDSKDSSSNVFGEVIKNATAVNKKYLEESKRLFNKLNNIDDLNNDLKKVDTDKFIESMTSIANLNLKYMSSLMDIGFSMVDNMLTTSEKTKEVYLQPAFVLRGTGKNKETVDFQFNIENTQGKEITCQLIHSPFEPEFQENQTIDFSLSFHPQEFKMPENSKQSVDAKIKIGARTTPGRYRTIVQVLGFEPTFFDIIITVEEATKQKKGNGSK